ncbi:MAG: hypothetical protein EG823_01525 [Actinobacteria bacterium]|nr:hypothetical protein [Actinomycetota bacterium]
MNILVVYFNRHHPIRASAEDHLYCFQRASEHRCYYLNAALPWVPAFVKRSHFDLVVFHNIFLWWRYEPKLFRRLCDRVKWTADLSCPKAMLPQDEHLQGDILEEFIERFRVTHVLSCADSTQWPLLYPSTDRERVLFSTVLPGYLSTRTLERISRIGAQDIARDLNIGYRAVRLGPSLGSHALLKVTIGEEIARRAADLGLATDISSNIYDTFLGDKWFEFLLRCKYTVGVEGGASVRDADGSVLEAATEYMKLHPRADFEEVEAAVFPGRDGEIAYHAISPRHLECCATRTCQILVEGEYSGILTPNVHYIPLKRDLSNLDEVLQAVVRDDLRTSLAEQAFKDIVASERYTYESFVKTVIARVFSNGAPGPHTQTGTDRIGYSEARFYDWLLWAFWATAWAIRRPIERAFGRERVRGWVNAVRRRRGEIQ